MTSVAGQDEVRTITDIPGWFSAIDQWLFDRFLSEDSVVPHGDLVEIGVYLGKSAVLIGNHKRPDETFTVCDLFGGETSDPLNETENNLSYSNLNREKFEQNYLAIHSELPVVVQEMSSTILAHVRPGSARFVHIDGSHLYAHVAVDVESARTLLLPEGVAAFDEFRAPHTPGVSAALWEAVFNKGLHPICLTRKKMYATFGDPRPHQDRLQGWMATSIRYDAEIHRIAGAPVVRLKEPVQQSTAAQGDSRRLSAELGELASRVASVDREVSKLRREVVRQRNDHKSVLRRGQRWAARLVRSKHRQ